MLRVGPKRSKKNCHNDNRQSLSQGPKRSPRLSDKRQNTMKTGHKKAVGSLTDVTLEFKLSHRY